MKEVTGTELRVCEDIARRQKLGIAKYQTTVANNPLDLRQWLEHAYQECLDQAIYLKRAIEEISDGGPGMGYIWVGCEDVIRETDQRRTADHLGNTIWTTHDMAGFACVISKTFRRKV